MPMQWLLLRGLGREQRHWHVFREALADELGAAHVHCVDVAGAGSEHAVVPRPSTRWLARDVARRVQGLASGLGPDQRWSVVGLSLGGMLALELCQMFPREIEAALIINASSRLTSASARLRPGAALQLLRAAASADPLERERIILGLTSALPQSERERHARRAAELARDRPSSRRAVMVQLMAASRFSPPVPGALGARLGFCCSRQDRLVSARCSHDLAAWYGRPCEEHPWAGHDLPLDDPEWLGERVRELSARLDARAGASGGPGAR